MASDNYKYSKKYDDANTTKVTVKLNLKTDADIVEYLKAKDNKQGTIKQALRELIKKEQGN